jgi:D-alanyl-D-alanine dipeptidase
MAPAEPNYAIPILDWSSNAGSYGTIPVDNDDPRSRDPLVPVEEFGIAGESFYSRRDGKNWPYLVPIQGSLSRLWCRRLVAEKLVEVNARLRSYGAELYVWDAYRPIECQRGLWAFFSEQSLREMPNVSDEARKQYVLNYVSDPTRFVRSDSTTWPVHSSGAAIDLTLRDLGTSNLHDMGARFDEMHPVSHSDYFEREPSSPHTDVIRRNRRLLHWAMTKEGFVNYPLEFWHFDWGNQMYVQNMKLLGGKAPRAAWFGYIDLPTS